MLDGRKMADVKTTVRGRKGSLKLELEDLVAELET